ncbi:DUF5050 domain-containing protein [Chengkuizengella axinellae]|uniref:DUF5050 domain-containing protein n=1 Tax=Chengkuizengella axinellae TaxID=3064388 RepID=A0ABT9IWI9_9BACL|nr:DUF5050 domain-containing protein [Chengkuizengella sp. 2205SS18-9]MDP5273712.1 DUF5050 domain-containing protein [Chengkuizengella sp. 2205SS18-9]
MENKEIKNKINNKKLYMKIIYSVGLVLVIGFIVWWLYPSEEMIEPPTNRDTERKPVIGEEFPPIPYPPKKPFIETVPEKPEVNLTVIESGNIIYDENEIFFRNELDDFKLYVLHNENAEPAKVMDEAVHLMAKIEDQILYTNTSDDGIYSINKDGTNKRTITEDSSHQFIVQDTWVYYVNASDQHKLTKIKLDGTEKEVLSDEEIDSFLINGEWIYYVNSTQEFRLYKMKNDGSSKLIVSKDSVKNVKIFEDWIYYLNESNIYKMNTDGMEHDLVSNEYIQFFQISEDWIYYRTEGVGGNLWRMKLDGTNKDQISISGYDPDFIEIWDGWVFYSSNFLNKALYILDNEKKKVSDQDVSSLIVYNNWIYYIDNDDYKLYRMDFNGEKIENVVDSIVTYYLIYNDKIFYRNASDENKLYESGLSGENNIKVLDQRFLKFELHGNQLYFIEDSQQQRLFQLDLESKELSKITDEQVYTFYILDGKIAYSSQAGSNIVDLDGSNLFKLTDGYIEEPKLQEDWIYYAGFEEQLKLFRIKQDGSDQTLLTSLSQSEYVILDDWIYYVENKKLHKIKTDGTDRTKISDRNVKYILMIEEGWIYASSSMQTGHHNIYTSLFKVKTDGSVDENLVNGYIEDLELTDQGLLFTENQERYRTFKVKIDGSDESVLYTQAS